MDGSWVADPGDEWGSSELHRVVALEGPARVVWGLDGPGVFLSGFASPVAARAYAAARGWTVVA
jgi:hypothetical protein